jgi:formyl-CoA transferase
MWLQLGEGLAYASLLGRDPERLGNGEPGRPLSGIFPSADGSWLAVVARVDAEQERLWGVIGQAQAGREGRDQWERAISDWTARVPAAGLVRILAEAGVGVAPANTYQQAVREPALLAVSAFERLHHPDAGEQTYLRVPVRFDGMSVRSRRPSPSFGEHSAEVLGEVGFSDEAIAELRRTCVVTDAPIGR